MLEVSIIIPVYCTTEHSLVWLAECLESAVSQDCKVIVYDDGSPINIDEVVRKYEVTKYIKGFANRGVSYARNRACYDVSNGLILPLDCDDTLAPQAVRKLYSAWDGTPVYPDVAKFGDEVEPHYVLLDFDCQHIIKFVGFTSVNVLHSKAQWEALGGWDESLDFFEDGEYNARLLGTYCGKRFPEPLINYRMHPNQRTKLYESKVQYYGKSILQRIRSMKMACPGCSKARRVPGRTGQSSNQAAASRSAETVEVQTGGKSVNIPPEFEGKVLTKYIGGKGAGRHYYRGIKSRFPYHVTYGDLVYAKPEDVGEGEEGKSRLIRVKPMAAVTPPPPVAPVPVPTPKPAAIVKEPVMETVIIPAAPEPNVATAIVEEHEVVETVTKPEHVVENLPDLSTMNIKQVYTFIDSADEETLRKLMKMELDGLNRGKVLSRIKSKLGA